jgi:cyclic pyranopterin phosphate synthase
MAPETLALIQAGQVGKGDVLGVARLAGIMEPSAPPTSSRSAIRCSSAR